MTSLNGVIKIQTETLPKIYPRGRHAVLRQLGKDAGRRASLLIEIFSTTLLLVLPLYDELISNSASFIQLCEAGVAGF